MRLMLGRQHRLPRVLLAAALAAAISTMTSTARALPSDPSARDEVVPMAYDWQPYGDRYAIVVMGGHESDPQAYDWFWADTYGMYKELIDQHGFAADHIRFLSYGDSAAMHPGEVHGISTVQEITNAYAWANVNCTVDDLLYVFWVDHGSATDFEANDGPMLHSVIGTLTKDVTAKQIIGAYNPCYSGAVIDDVSASHVITITSQDAFNTNAWGWAGAWRRALRGRAGDAVDTNQDGQISMTEAYSWIAPKSRNAGEHSMYDDNGDGTGHESNDPAYDPLTPGMDGYKGKYYSLDGWAQVTPVGELVLNGDFEAGFYRDANDSIPHAWLKHETRPYEDSTLRPDSENGPTGPGRTSLYWTRTENSASGDWTMVRQPLDIAVANYASLRLDLDVKAIDHNLGGSGWTPEKWEYPVTVVVYFLDDTGRRRYWQYGWFIYRSQNTEPTPNGLVVRGGEGIVYSEQVNADQWYAESFDLIAQLSTLATPSRITEIRVGGSGWSFQGKADNVRIIADRDRRPYVWIDPRDYFHDSFSNDGSLSGSIRLDVARDIGIGSGIVPGDSLVAEVVPASGHVIVDVKLKWSIVLNPSFQSIRVVPGGALYVGTDDRGWQIFEGEVEGEIVHGYGVPVGDRYAFDLPDGPPNLNAPWQTHEDPFCFPGDVLHYQIEATDDQAETTTLPADVWDFHEFGETTAYPRAFTVRALPTLDAAHPDGQPEVLVWIDTGARSTENLYAFRNIGMYEGWDYDTYTTLVPTMGQGNGLGSAGAHGANAAQLAGYPIILYFCHDLERVLISDGTNVSGNDKSTDVDVLTDWHSQAADRKHAYFGDDFICGMAAQGNSTNTYAATILGAEPLDCDIGDAIGYEPYPEVWPTSSVPWFSTGLVLPYGGMIISDFDHISPSWVGSVESHQFTLPLGTPFSPLVCGGVYWDRPESGFQKTTIVFPYSFSKIQTPSSSHGIPARARLLEEILFCFGYFPSGPPIGAPPVVSARLELHPNVPNPFNPRTEIRFTAPARGPATVAVYSIRGEKVATLFEGIAQEGRNEVVWNGCDGRHRAVASGVYICRVEGFGQVVTRKMVIAR